MKVRLLALVARIGGVSFAFEGERVFRPVIYGRCAANVRSQHPIGEASWIWMPGHDIL